MRTKKQIILIITLILILNLTILTASTKQDKTPNPFERFGLEYPAQEETITTHTEIRTTSQPSQEEIKVIITLKEPEEIQSWRNQVRTFNEETKKELKGVMREQTIKKITKEKTKHRYSSFNGFSAMITQKEYEELQRNPLIKEIYEDKPVIIFMQNTTKLIGAENTWKKQIKGINITGKGQTVCVIDTGIKYSHEDLGNCTSIYNETTQEKDLIHNITSQDYPGYKNYEGLCHVQNISFPKHDKISIYFSDLNIAQEDILYLENKEKSLIWWFQDIDKQNMWSPLITGDTVNLELCTKTNNGRGYEITKIKGKNLTTNCDKVIGGHNFYNGNNDPTDQDGHGTHVAGTIAANNELKGVAPESKLVAIKSLDTSGGFKSDILAGIEYCTTNKEKYNISVISMSLGDKNYRNETYCDEDFPLYSTAINKAVEQNISVVIATGNEYDKEKVSSPACIENAIRVGSTTKNDAMSSFSNRWSLDMLLAPGSNINSTCASGEYCSMDGTSMATPHVAGAIAVLNQYLLILNSSRTPSELNDLLNETGENVTEGEETFKRINLLSAVEKLEQEYWNISMELGVSESVIELFNGSVVVSWNASSNEDFNSSLFVYNSSSDVVFDSNDSFGNATLNSSSGPSSVLNWSGRYEVVFNIFNNFFNRSASEEFFVRKHPDFDLLVNDSSQGLIHNVSGDVIHGYFGEYNVSVLVVDAELNNISLYFNNSPISFENASGLNINISGFYLFEANHSESDHYFFGGVSKYLNISDFPSINVDGFDPSSPVSLEKEEVVTFSVINASSEDDKQLNYSWVFSNETILETNNSAVFVLNASDYLAGSYNLSVNVSNDFNNVSYTWNITILPSYYLFFLEEVENVVLNSMNNLTINASNYFYYRGDNFSVNLTNQSLNYSVSEDIITVFGSTSPGIYFTKINASINASGDLILNESNDFEIFISEVTSKKDFDNVSVYSSQNLSINLSEHFLFSEFPNFNLTNQNLNFEINESINEMIIITNVSGNYSTKINASMEVSFAESNNFTIFIIDPFLSFNFSNNISDKSFEEGKSVTINLSNHFSFGGANKEFSLTNSNLSYELSGEEIRIESNTPGNYMTKINASVDSLNNLSNEFKVTVTKKETTPSNGGGSDAPSSAPPPPAPLSDPEPEEEEETTIISKSMRVLTNDSFVNITKNKTEVHEKYTLRIYEAYHFVFFENVTNVSLEFEVNNSWLESEELEPELVALFYYNGDWLEAFTELKNVSEEVATYTSVAEVAEYYLVGEKQRAEEPVFVPATQDLVGGEDSKRNSSLLLWGLFIMALVVIILVVFELKRKKVVT